MGADRPGQLADGDPLPRAASLACSRPSSAYQPAAFKPKVIGSAWMPWLRPTIGVCRCSTASLRATSASPATSLSTTAVASRSTAALAVSSRSELVSP